MTDDGSQPPVEQLATAVHRGPATSSWCGPLLLTLQGEVAMLSVFSACCLMSRFLGWVSGNKHSTWEILKSVEVLICNPNDPYISVHSERGSVTQQ